MDGEEQPQWPPQNPQQPPRKTIPKPEPVLGSDFAFQQPQSQAPLPAFPVTSFGGGSGLTTTQPVTASIVPMMPFTKPSPTPAFLPEGAKKHQSMFAAFPMQVSFLCKLKKKNKQHKTLVCCGCYSSYVSRPHKVKQPPLKYSCRRWSADLAQGRYGPHFHSLGHMVTFTVTVTVTLSLGST